MKSKMVLFLSVLLLTAIGIEAQPRCREMFNPFYICLSNYQNSEYFFYGEIISTEELKDTSSGAYLKAVVKIEKNFRGNLPKEITLYFGQRVCSNTAPKNTRAFQGLRSDGIAANANNNPPKNTFLFLVGSSTLNGQRIYVVQDQSRPMRDYSEKAVEEVFKSVESALGNQKKDFVEGTVFERLLKIREVSLKSEDADRLSVDLKSRLPLPNILIEATSEKDGRVYRATSKTDGTFRIDNIPKGIYKIKLNLPPDKEQQTLSRGIDDSSCSRRWNIMVMPKTSNQNR